MGRVFDLLSYPFREPVRTVLGFAILLWANFAPHSFIATVTNWGRHQLAPIVQHLPTTSTTVKR